jgi:formylglycine-generating enzyme required for sulfatase activity/serine/threonine protein kinase
VRIGEFEVDGERARGSSGAVLTARHERLKEWRVAIKLLETSDAVRTERFFREAEILARIRHPNVVTIHDAGVTEDGRPYLVMELLEGTTLAQELDHAPLERLLDLLADAARGVVRVHELALVHRNLEPANVLISSRGAKVSGFGIARGVDQRTALTKTGTTLGTLAYMSPEQARGEAVGKSSDVFGLGAILYHILAGRPPYEGAATADLLGRIEQARVVPPSKLAAEKPPAALEALCLRALARDPAARPGDALVFLEELEMARRTPRVSPSSRPHTLLVATGLALGSLALFLAARREETPPVRSTTGEASLTSARSAAPTIPLPAASEPQWYVALFEESSASAPSWFSELAPGDRPPTLPPGVRYLARRCEYLDVADGSVLVWIPGGAFFIGKREVTYQQFERFTARDPRHAPDHPGELDGVVTPRASWRSPLGDGRTPPFESPVRQITWDDAKSYCAWARIELPSTERWRSASTCAPSSPLAPGESPWDAAKHVLRLGRIEKHAAEHRALRGALRVDGDLGEWCDDGPESLPAEHYLFSCSFAPDLQGLEIHEGHSGRGAATAGHGFRVSVGIGGPRLATSPAEPRLAGRMVPAADGKEVPLYTVRLPDGSEMEMVQVPAGTFVMGANDSGASAAERPRHMHEVRRTFWVGRHDVTWSQYLAFCRKTGRSEPEKPSWWGQVSGEKANHPVVNVSWDDAAAYCEWTGLTLPSEAEWEKAARGSDGRRWPWGDEWDPGTRCNFVDVSCPLDTILAQSGKKASKLSGRVWDREHDDGYAFTSPVGSFPRGVSPCGALDMAGNVEQWCEDWYDAKAYDRYALGDDEPPPGGQRRVRRGGSWYGDASRCRSSSRTDGPPASHRDEVGFRVVFRSP